jgi:hypothetical protein
LEVVARALVGGDKVLPHLTRLVLKESAPSAKTLFGLGKESPSLKLSLHPQVVTSH